MSDSITPQNWKKTQSKINPYLTALLVVMVLAGGGLTLLKGPAFVKDRVKTTFEKRLSPLGIEKVDIGSIRWGWGRIYMRDIQAHASSAAPTLSIQEMDVALSAFLNVKAIDARGLTLEWKDGEAVPLSTEGWQAKLALLGKALSGAKSLALPALTLHDGLVIAPSPQGLLKIPMQASHESTVKGNQVLTLDWGEPEKHQFSGQGVLEIGRDGLTVDIQATHIDLKWPSVHLKAAEVSFWGATAHEEEGGYKVEGFAKLDHLALPSYGTLKAPLEVTIEGAGTDKEFTLEEFTIASAESDANLLEVEGMLKPDQPSAEMVLAAQIPQLSRIWDFTPLLAAYAGDRVVVDGVVNLAGKIRWEEGGFKPSVVALDVKEGHLAREGFSVEGAAFTLNFKGVKPFVTQGNQRLLATKLSFGKIQLKNALLEGGLDENGLLQIQQFTAELLSGTLKAHRFQRLSERSSSYQFESNFNNIELADILALTDLNNLSGHAKLAGSALMSWGWEEGVEVIQAELHAISEAGLIQYKPGEAVFSQQKEVNMAFQVLDDLNFTLFNVRLGRAPHNPLELQAIVKILGSNPKVLKGYPFEFNIVTTGKLKDLVVNTLHHIGPYKDLHKLTNTLHDAKEAKVPQKAAKTPKPPKKSEKLVKTATVVKRVVKKARRGKQAKWGKRAKKPKPVNRKLKDG